MNIKPDILRPVYHLGIALVIVFTNAITLQGEEVTHVWDKDLDLKPAVLNAVNDGDWAAALRWRGRMGYDYSPWRGNITAFAAGQTRGTLATDSRAHSEDISAEIDAGMAWQLQRPPKLGDSPPISERDPNSSANTPPPGGGLRLGRIELSAKVAFETDQPLENYALTYGPQLGYFHNNEDGLWPFVPSFYVDYQRVDLLESQFYRSLGLSDDDSFYRFSAIASWQLPVGTWVARDNRYISALGAVANLRYTLAHDVPTAIKLQGKNESWYYEAGLNYSLVNFGTPWIRSVYVTAGRGRIPPALEDKTMVYVGVVLGWGKPGKDRSHRFF